jgi:hypothetical protein
MVVVVGGIVVVVGEETVKVTLLLCSPASAKSPSSFLSMHA